MGEDIDWIRRGLAAPGKTQSGLAAAMGRYPSAVTELLRGKRRLKADEIPAIAAYLEVNPPIHGVTAANRAFGLARVDGTVQAGAFLQAEIFDDDPGQVISAPRDPDFPFARQIAYRAAGDSMNRAEPRPIRDGDYLICVAFEDTGLEPADGMIVVVQQTINDGQLRERSVKELRRFEDRTEFHPKSDNPVHKPIIVPKNRDPNDGREVKILALLRFVFDAVPVPVPVGGRK